MHQHAQESLVSAILAVDESCTMTASTAVGTALGGALVDLCNLQVPSAGGEEFNHRFTLKSLIEEALACTEYELGADAVATSVAYPLGHDVQQQVFYGNASALKLAILLLLRGVRQAGVIAHHPAAAKKAGAQKLAASAASAKLSTEAMTLHIDVATEEVDYGLQLRLAVCYKHGDMLLASPALADSSTDFFLGFMTSLHAHVEAEEAGVELCLPLAYHAEHLLLDGKRVLIADDNKKLLDVYCSMVEALGATVTGVADGLAAVNQCAEHDFDLFLTDIDMPIMDGCEAIQKIVEDAACKSRACPLIVALTALADKKARDRSVKNGAILCLRKPFEIGMIKQIVRKHLLGIPSDITYAHEANGVSVFFDVEQLRATYELMGGGSEAQTIIDSMIDDFKQDGPQTINEIQKYSFAQDTLNSDVDIAENQAVISRIAHKMKSRATAIGLKGLGAIAAEIEHSARDGHFDQQMAETLLPQLMQSLTAGLAAVDIYMEKGVFT